ncbi:MULTISPECIES: TIGR03086 family metal-binding protein [Streptomyces]|uniref:TIGR03086 family protein n=1 Tax=Streptomyces dengpaensis TaxID=2049881 RepID=A0ABN5HWT2_9ACTN|nr:MULTISPECIES: TIGR03086 family metal-binding protein [Streptomyces]AVH54976.1 TIGR03086 family protein [Streptomyces dengpaensis]PIB08276.1 TIGR03086 family protein [Streptomyces sp. HG99]
MNATPVELADQLARAARNLVAHVQQPALTGKRELPTPCADFDVHQLSEHLLATLVMSAHAAGKEQLPADAPTELTEAPWVVFPPLADRLTAAWAVPSAWEGETPFASNTYPAPFAGMITIMELTVHGWDLATATGQPFTADDDVVATATAVATQIADGARANGAFGPEIEPAADATPLERLLAFTGRKAA